MSIKQSVIEYKNRHPHLTYVEIGRVFDRDPSSIRELLNPNVYTHKQEQRRKMVREKKVSMVKEFGGKCHSCGYKKYPEILEFHHHKPDTKAFGISQKRNAPLDTIREEAKKCILLCPNCHRELHLKK